MELPGDKAHFLMEPPERRQFKDQVLTERLHPRLAAVLALFYPKNGKTHLVMILRRAYQGVHSNQIAFPGGKAEDFDADMWHTALRETEEEVGVPSSQVQLVKSLSKVYIPPSNFWVQPYMGLYADPQPFSRQESEVEAILEVPLAQVMDNQLLINQKLRTSYAKNIEVPTFKLKGHVVWGATAMMLNEIKMLLRPVL